MASQSILIDANALADFFVGEEAFRRDAVELRRKYPYWRTLPLCRYEFGNVLRTYIRGGKLSEAKGLAMLRDGYDMVSMCPECEGDVILAEANASRLSFYDAAYVACARSMDLRLYTRDGEILKNCPEIACPISEAWPKELLSPPSRDECDGGAD